uniref:Uncharacterized protein n=1 Tax=Chrysotila carterae TaxID=13221 RepID=A0A7S4BCJ8_CHRCT
MAWPDNEPYCLIQRTFAAESIGPFRLFRVVKTEACCSLRVWMVDLARRASRRSLLGEETYFGLIGRGGSMFEGEAYLDNGARKATEAGAGAGGGAVGATRGGTLVEA